MNQFHRWIAAISLAATLSTARANDPAAAPLRPTQNVTVDQTLDLPDGRKVAPRAEPLVVRPTLNFAVENLEPEKVLSVEAAIKEREKLVKRANAAHEVVRECIFNAAGEPNGTSEEMLARLRQRWAAQPEGSTLKQDLGNMLISTLAQVEVQPDAAAPRAPFRVWTYRSLRDLEHPDALCGPPIEVQPNSTLFIPVLNLLRREELALPDSEIPDAVPLGSLNEFHGFDVLNLHTHGLNVSPEWPADDVFREIHPYQLKFFVYHVPPDHVPGTFWYHPHKHGAAMTHVGGGMAGPLIVSGPVDEPIGLDQLGKARGWQQDWRNDYPPLILQQFAFYRQRPAADQPEPRPYFFRPDFFSLFHINNVENTPPDAPEETFPYAPRLRWMRANLEEIKPGIKFWVSGRFNPELKEIRAGATTRLRLINGGIDEKWTFGIRSPEGVPADQVRIQVIAWDGIPLPEPHELNATTSMVIAPGNRADVLVWFGQGAADRMHHLTATVATGNQVTVHQVATIPVVSGSIAEAAFLKKDDADLLAVLKPTPPPATSGVTFDAEQRDMAVRTPTGIPATFNTGRFRVNGLPFPGKPRFFDLYRTATIKLGSSAFGHPFHWHVNPIFFEASEDRRARGLPPGPYWADVVLGGPQADTGVMGFEHWPGKTVVHCHILDHEDLGMMNVLEIRNPSGSPVAPLPGVLDEITLKPGALAAIKPEWPRTGALQPPNGLVTVYVFLPRPEDLQECAHCTVAINGIAALRNEDPTLPPIRIIAITGPNSDGVEELALGLQLDHEKDRVCTDAQLIAFQALALVDGTPVFNGQLFTFPHSLKDGKIRYASDVMHGVFVVDPSGFIVSAHRGFRAHDDAAQIRSEIRVAQDVPKALKENAARIEAMPENNGMERAFKRQEKLNLQRFQLRYEAHTKQL